MENSTDFDENVEKNDERNIYNIFSSLYYRFSLPTYRSKIRYAIKILGTITLSNQIEDFDDDAKKYKKRWRFVNN